MLLSPTVTPSFCPSRANVPCVTLSHSYPVVLSIESHCTLCYSVPQLPRRSVHREPMYPVLLSPTVTPSFCPLRATVPCVTLSHSYPVVLSIESHCTLCYSLLQLPRRSVHREPMYPVLLSPTVTPSFCPLRATVPCVTLSHSYPVVLSIESQCTLCYSLLQLPRRSVH